MAPIASASAQIPHVDFASPVGALTLYLTHFAERLFPGGQPFIGLHALAWLMVVPPFAVIASRIQSGWGFAASFAILAVVVLVPYTLDSTMLSEISYFATYNRFATAILFLAALWYVLPKARGDGVLLGYLLTALIFIKITAAIAMLGLVVAAVLLGRARPAALFAMLLVTAALAGLIELATGGLVSGYLHDIVSMSALNRGGAVFRLAASSARNWLPHVVTITIVVLAARELDFTAALRRPLNFVRDTIAREAFAVDAALLVAVALAAESQNTGGVGLIAAAAVLLHPSLRTTRGWRLIAAAVLGATLVLPMADVVEKRVVSTFVRERQGTTDHGFATFLPGMRVPTATLAGSRLMTRLQSEWLPYLDETANNGFDLDGDPGQHEPGDARGVGCQRCRGRRELPAARLRDQGAALYDHRFCRILPAAARPDARARHHPGDGFPPHGACVFRNRSVGLSGGRGRCVLPHLHSPRRDRHQSRDLPYRAGTGVHAPQTASLLGFLQPYPLKGPACPPYPCRLFPNSPIRERRRNPGR